MNYNRFKFEAVIDVLRIEAYQSHSRLKQVTITDVQSYERVETRYLAPLRKEGADRFVVTLCEISFDIKPKDPKDPEQAAAARQLLGDMVRFSKHPYDYSGDQLRYYRTVTDCGQIANGRQIHDALSKGGTVYIGHQRPRGNQQQNGYFRPVSPVAFRAYWKTTDGQRGNKAKQLQPDQHRARFEVTLQASGLPVTDWDEWQRLPLTDFARYFYQRQDEDASRRRPDIAARPGAKHGPDKINENRRAGKTARAYATGTAANKALNDCIRDRLNTLDKRVRGSLRQKIVGKIGGDFSKNKELGELPNYREDRGEDWGAW